MKKNWMKLLSLMLCMMLICPAALAQEVSYIIGEPTRDAVFGALGRGHVLTAETKIGLELDAAALGMTQEDADDLALVLDALDQATLTVGFGAFDEGIRLTLEGELADPASGDAVSVSAAINVTLDGLSIESDLLEGRRVTASWEALLALGGLDQESISIFTTAKDLLKSGEGLDMLEAMVTELLAELESALATFGDLFTPYVETIANFIVTLPIEMKTDLHEENYPATATEISVTVTAADLGRLLTQLCDQTAADAELMQLLDEVLAESGEEITAADFISALREEAKSMTGTTPMVFYLGMDENNMPMYLEMYVTDEATGETAYVGLFGYEDEDTSLILELMIGMYDREGEPTDVVYLGGSYLDDDADPNVYLADFMMSVTESGNPVVEFVMALSCTPAEGASAEYETSVVYSMSVNDGVDNMQMLSNTEGRNGATANGGEFSTGTSQLDAYADGLQMSASSVAETLVEPTADGGITGYYRVSESMPSSGIKNLSIDAILGSQAYDPVTTEALKELRLEEMTNDEMDALAEDVTNTLINDKLLKMLEILPAEVTQMLMAEGE